MIPVPAQTKVWLAAGVTKTAGPGNYRSDGPEARHSLTYWFAAISGSRSEFTLLEIALTIKLDHSMGADQTPSSKWQVFNRH